MYRNKILISVVCICLFASLSLGCTQTSGDSSKSTSKEITQEELEDAADLLKEENEQPSQEYLDNKAKIEEIGNKLKSPGDTQSINQLALDLVEPESFIQNYLKENPNTIAGAEELGVIAATHNLFSALVGGHEKYAAENYYLLIELYPDHELVTDAKIWLRTHKYDID